ncbi:MAG: hypothetical protein GY770_12935 [Aestuariibacter sp.]|nr:hypothetical protein [Aestuariibacter sp.]MCP5017392.1 hypothetical protein [Ketobacter sp.]
MSKSSIKTPITGITTCTSEKGDKQMANRIARRSIKQKLSSSPLGFTHVDRREFRFNNIWAFGKDGKHFFGHLKWEDPKHYRKLMRK